MRLKFSVTKVRTLLPALLICLLAPAAVASAQDNPLSAWNKTVYGGVKKILLRTAEKVPEENYSFKPTEAVRSFGQILGHVADAQYMFCSIVLGEKNPAPKVEETKTSKADLIAALKDAFAYCDKAYDGMTDASATQMVKLFGGDRPKLGVLTVNNIHSVEHYGNLVTYMRLKNIVPPTSEPDFMPQPKK
ncbi:MAG TPA: DinB family protein [Thermoanaerobaculia bacterium]|nr:DinB family protein [Thermoanaerobaculia bacterium]